MLSTGCRKNGRTAGLGVEFDTYWLPPTRWNAG